MNRFDFIGGLTPCRDLKFGIAQHSIKINLSDDPVPQIGDLERRLALIQHAREIILILNENVRLLPDRTTDQ